MDTTSEPGAVIPKKSFNEKASHYSQADTVELYDHRRFGRGSGLYVRMLEESSLRNLLAQTKAFGNMNAVDCPVGTGRMIPILKESGYNVTAADISQPMLDLASKYSAQKYLLSSADKLPLEPNTMGLWLMSRFCFHFENPTAFLREASRVLAPGGHLIFDAYRWTPRSWIPGDQAFLGGRTHNHSSADVARMAKDCGFTVVREIPVFFLAPYIYGFFPLWLTKTLEFFSNKIAPGFKTKSYFLLRKN